MSNSSNSSNSTYEAFEEIKPTKISVFTPLIYVAIVLTALIVFSKVYRQRSISKLTHTKPFFPPNIQKEMYRELASQTPKPNDKVLKAALFRWASESIRRSIKLKECEQSITKMYQYGSIGDELFTRYLFAKKLEELEFQEIAREVEGIKPGWTQKFFPLIQEITFNEALSRRIAAINSLSEQSLELWGYKREDIGKLATNARVQISK